jgi:hypothetical protein
METGLVHQEFEVTSESGALSDSQTPQEEGGEEAKAQADRQAQAARASASAATYGGHGPAAGRGAHGRSASGLPRQGTPLLVAIRRSEAPDLPLLQRAAPGLGKPSVLQQAHGDVRLEADGLDSRMTM